MSSPQRHLCCKGAGPVGCGQRELPVRARQGSDGVGERARGGQGETPAAGQASALGGEQGLGGESRGEPSARRGCGGRQLPQLSSPKPPCDPACPCGRAGTWQESGDSASGRFQLGLARAPSTSTPKSRIRIPSVLAKMASAGRRLYSVVPFFLGKRGAKSFSWTPLKPT